MAGFTQQVERPAGMLLGDENVVSVEGGDGKDRDVVVRQRRDEGEQDSGLGEREWAFEFEADPARR